VVLAAIVTTFRKQSIVDRILIELEDNIGIWAIGFALLPLEL